jgi:hypothetical protein
MRLKARTNFSYEGATYKAEDLLDVPNEVGVAMMNRDLAMIWNLEDHTQRSEIPADLDATTEPVPDVPPVTLSPTEAAALATGGAGSFDVAITGPGTSGTWTVDKDAVADWLTVVSPTTPQATDGTVDYDVAPNDAAERTANMYVNGKTFTLTQDGVSARGAKAHNRR